MRDTDVIILRLLDVADELEHRLGDSWPALREVLTDLILRLEAEGQSISLRRDTDNFLACLRSSPAREFVLELVDGGERSVCLSAPRSSELTFIGNETKSPAMEGRNIVIPVYFATDRKVRPEASIEDRFTSEHGQLSFGVALVSIPWVHEIGVVESPRWWHLEFRPDPRKHVVLLGIETIEHSMYVNYLKNEMESAGSNDVIIYLHGFNVRFADAARRAAQIAHDLMFPGRTLLYSWPSKGGTSGYLADADTIEWVSTPQFEKFLRVILTEIGATKVHLIAHSMGSRALARAIERLDTSSLPTGSASLHQIIFAAPDISRTGFLTIAKAFHDRAKRFTLYASDHDVALKLSKLLHQGPRAGDLGSSPFIVPGIDTIDASRADTNFFGLGHSYYGDKRSILNDISTLLAHETPPGKRFDLREQASPAGTYWLYHP